MLRRDRDRFPCVAAFWESNANKGRVSALLGVPVALYVGGHAPELLWHTGLEYVSFIMLLGALFTISGGIVLRGDLRATPAINTGFLAVGALLANVIGTTGASMLLIRPLLQTNSERKHVDHIPILFIFVVSNCAGLLTPLGDPPLFLGYLRGGPVLLDDAPAAGVAVRRQHPAGGVLRAGCACGRP
jgi:Na+/H+ antiporter NhaD/arsenite permease-like protein